MGLFQRYLSWFEGEPTWLIILVTMILLAGLVVITERLVKVSAWLLLTGFIACVVFGIGWLILVGR